MFYAILNGKRISAEEANKNDKSLYKCPCCNSDLIIKQGEFKIWHFAHKSKNDCSMWFKPMTEWHKSWQMLFPNHNQEVIHICSKTNEKHIADIKTDNGVIIEFQHSSISSKEIKSREDFYGEKMIWVLDGNSFKIEHYEFKKYNHKYSVEYMLKKNNDVIKKFNEQLSKPFGCHKDFIFEYLKKGMEFYRYLQNMVLGNSRSKFFDISKRHIFIDFGSYLLYLKNDNDKNFIVEHKDYIYSKSHEYWVGKYSKTIKIEDWELGNEFNEPFQYDQIENLFGLDIYKLKSKIFKKISKQDFIKKYAKNALI